MKQNAAIPQSSQDDEATKKARMLISILGPEFTRNSSHPFFKTLTETAAKPVLSDKGQPDISRALKNLMARLSAKDSGPQSASVEHPDGTDEDKITTAVNAETVALDETQHPVLLAKTLLTHPPKARAELLKTLSRPVARRVMVYLRELQS